MGLRPTHTIGLAEAREKARDCLNRFAHGRVAQSEACLTMTEHVGTMSIRFLRLLASIGEQTVIECVPRGAAQFRNLLVA